MLFKQAVRLFHVNHAIYAAEKSALATLRKKTGYTFSNCKKALELHQNDLVKAEEWLKQQAQTLGWSKATKLEGRSTTQGLIGVLIKNNIGAMIEVNCETDFVARNQNFQQFVQTASLACLNHISGIESKKDLTKISIEQEGLNKLVLQDGKTLNDHLALLIGTVGENASLKRAICFKTNETIKLSGYAHPAPNIEDADSIKFGKYGTIVAFSGSASPTVQKNLCQHIVGMNPLRIGEKGKDEPTENKDDEICLIHQEYLLDPEQTIAQVLETNQIEIIDFQRFECGESAKLEEIKKVEAVN